jgi:uncharacterized protein (DUF2062 family)
VRYRLVLLHDSYTTTNAPSRLNGPSLEPNIPLSIALVWVTNPITMGPIFYANYKFGSWLLQTPVYELNFEWSAGWLWQQLHYLWKPLYAGSLMGGHIGFSGLSLDTSVMELAS